MFRGLSLRRKLTYFVAVLLLLAGGTIAVESYFLHGATRLITETNQTAKAMRWLTMASISNHSLSRSLSELVLRYEAGNATAESALAASVSDVRDLKEFVAQSLLAVEKDQGQTDNVRKIDLSLRKLAPGIESLQRELTSATLPHALMQKKLDELTTYMSDIDDNVVLAIIKAAEIGDRNLAAAEGARAGSLLLSLVAALAVAIVAGGTISFAFHLARQLSRMSGSLRAASETVSEASKEIYVAGEQMSERASKQLEVTSGARETIDEFARMIQQMADVSRRNSQSVESARHGVNDGMHVMDELLKAMDGWKFIRNEMQEIKGIVSAMETKTKVIHEIVFKCEILSFNASIEAARARQAGLGFAVVAQEIGALARASGAAASEITELLEQNQERASYIASSIENRVDLARASSLKCRESFETISRTIESFVSQIEALESSSRQHVTGVGLMKKSSEETIEAALDSSRSAAQVFDLTPRLRSEASGMMKHVDQLDRLVSGSRKRT